MGNVNNFNKFKTNPYCVGGGHYSDTNNVRGVVTSKGTKMLKGNFVKCKRKKSMKVSISQWCNNSSRRIEKFL